MQAAVVEQLRQSYQWVDITADVGDGKFSSLLARSVQVERTTYDDDNRAIYRCRLSPNMLRRLEQQYDIAVSPVTENTTLRHSPISAQN